MSSRRGEDIDPAITIVGISLVLALLVVLAISKNISEILGANFWTVFAALIYTAMGLMLWVGLLWAALHLGMLRVYNLGCAVGLLLAGTAAVVWWFFCPVMDSMAIGGGDPLATNRLPFYGELPWWDSGLFQWGVTLVFVALGAFFYRLHARQDY